MSKPKVKYYRKFQLTVKDALTIINNHRLVYETNPEYSAIKGIEYDPMDTRYSLYMEKGVKCVKCDIEANLAAFERHKVYHHKQINIWHWNFYYKSPGSRGKELMMTRDHILPKSLGGTDDISNCQPMCEKCNVNKGDGVVKVKEMIEPNVPIDVATQLPRNEIEDMVSKALSRVTANDHIDYNVFKQELTSQIYTHLIEGHNELPSNSRFKKLTQQVGKIHKTHYHLHKRNGMLVSALIEKGIDLPEYDATMEDEILTPGEIICLPIK